MMLITAQQYITRGADHVMRSITGEILDKRVDEWFRFKKLYKNHGS
jgi:hypothetical protein